MSRDFYDTSSFAKLFLSEPDSDAVLRRFRTASEVVVSWLTFVEMRSAVQKLVHRGILSQADAEATHKSIDQTASEVAIIPLLEEDFKLAENLVRIRDLRALDALQLSSAISAAASGGFNFIVSDSRLREAALAEGIAVVNPS